jgi:hypothetical protein
LDADIAHWLEMAEVRVNDELYRIGAAQPGNPAGAEIMAVGGGVATALTAIDWGIFNRTIGLGIERPVTEADLDSIMAFYDGLARATSVVQLAPQAIPAEAATWLETRGYRAGRRWAKLWRPLDTLPEANPALRIEQVVTPEQRADFGRVVPAAFEFPPVVMSMVGALIGRPGWTHYLGYVGDEAASASAMYVIDRMAWLGYGSTLEPFRGRGWQAAMVTIRLRHAAELGCRFALTETGEDTPDAPSPSYRNMKRAGFRDGYLRQNRIRKADASP